MVLQKCFEERENYLKGFASWRNNFCKVVLVSLIMSVGLLEHAYAYVKICNQAPYPIYITYAYKSTISGNLEIRGWWERQAGECLPLEKSSNSIYYYHAHPTGADIVSKSLDENSGYWGGKEGDDDSAKFCAPSDAFHRNSTICKQSDVKYIFKRFSTNGNKNYTQTLSSDDAERKLGLKIKSLEDAASAYRSIKGQLLYGKSLGSDPKGTPFRLGIEIEADDYGVVITRVSAGMPADGMLKRGDRLMMVNGKKIRTVFDAIVEVQDSGYLADPSSRNLRVGVLRWHSLNSPPVALEGTLDLTYYRDLDSAITEDGKWNAGGTALFNGATVGLAPIIVCAGKRIIERWNEKPAHQFDENCLDRERKHRARTYEMYPDQTQIFDLIGSGFSPRLVWRLLAKQGTKRSLRRVMVGAADEAVQGAVQELAWAKDINSISPPEVLKSMAVGAVIGTSVSSGTGK